MHPSHVLVPLDGSPLADDALAHALAVFDCQITVLNVLTPVDATMSEGGILEVDESRQVEAEKRANQLIDRAKQHATEKERTVETAVESGEPAETIVEYAEQHDVDHIVIGAHGGNPSEFARRLLGTVPTAVLGESGVTVTVVR